MTTEELSATVRGNNCVKSLNTATIEDQVDPPSLSSSVIGRQDRWRELCRGDVCCCTVRLSFISFRPESNKALCAVQPRFLLRMLLDHSHRCVEHSFYKALLFTHTPDQS